MTTSSAQQAANQKKGAVLVIGGGIGGIQAALDLAESGYHVYLVEKSPAIGGVMAQLDKTFPTNDCSMCILSPKLVEAGRHRNINIITQATIERIEGEAGNFKVTVKKTPRYIIEDKCTGCGECAEVCPIEVPSEFEQGLTLRKAIFRPFAQTFPNTFTIDKKERPPCLIACPARVNVQGYIALIAKGKYQEALALIKENIPLPGVIGRICPHPCEVKCNRGLVDELLSICGLKRFVADHVKDEELPPQVEAKEKVAIIGSGPAGLSCSYYLAKQGYQVTIFEALPVVGGMLYVGIPEYRLPKEILEAEVDSIRRLGIEVKTDTPIGKHLTLDDLFCQEYKAIFISVGANISQRLGITGEDSQGVLHGVAFLRDLNLGNKVRVGKRVAVIGGGNVAIDAARCAVRLGSEVFILYRRSRVEMPASDEEIEAAETEGIKIEYLVAPTEILAQNGRVAGIRCVRMELGEPDASGRRRPIPIKGSEFDIDVDMVIPAIGQSPDLSFLTKSSGVETTEWGTLIVDPVTLTTTRGGVFAGGDARTGPATAIEAIADGKKAAISIDRYLKGEELKEDKAVEKEISVEIDEIPFPKEKWARVKMPTLSAEQRLDGFGEVELGFTEEMAAREANRCLNCGVCSECLLCIAACKAEAINHKMGEELVEVQVGSVILAPGFDEFDASLVSQYGYGEYPNVITSIEFERILSASGPYQGELLRPSDRQKVQKIAWIQCVGSRGTTPENSYCSSVCCTYAIKEAVVAKEHSNSVEATIFFMDMRTFGKGFEAYYERAMSEYGVRFIRCRPSVIEEVLETKNLKIKYETEDGKLIKEEFGLVVLSVGLEPPKEAKELANKLGIELNKYGFCQTDNFSPVGSSKPGIFVCGAFQGPKDIPETVMQASAAAASAAASLSSVRNSLVKRKEYPPERDIRGEPPRIGVFVCHCGINIGGVVNVSEVKEYASLLPNVVYAEDNLYTCSQDAQERIKEVIREYNLNRVVVASCTPRTHEPLFQETIREAGLNRYLFEMANIRDQCSWVHKEHPEEATEKAKKLVRMAVAKARLIQSVAQTPLEVIHSCMVIGGGVAGMVAALNLAEQGFEVYLVEKSDQLGGIARRIQHSLEGNDVQSYLQNLIAKVSENRLIQVYTNADIIEATGYVGNFTTSIAVGPSRATHELKHGVVIIATGGNEYKPSEYLYGKDSRVLTLLELEDEISKGNTRITGCSNAVIIQCVGSREGNQPYCSRVCCSESIKCTLKLKEANPKMNIYILYRDMRTYGFREDYYQEARERGVIFVRYEAGDKPRVETTTEDNRLRVTVKDPILGEDLIIEADILALGVATIPAPDNKRLSQLFKVPLNEDGFLLEAHMKLRPVDFATEGVFLCGLAHGPKFIEESIAQAEAAASRAGTILSKDIIETGGIVSLVNKSRCSGCGICKLICPFRAIEIDDKEKVAVINEALCKGCGACVSSCICGAISIKGFGDAQILAMIDAT